MRLRNLIACLLAIAPLALSCQRRATDMLEEDPAGLEVRLFIPDALLTKAETGNESALDPEKRVSSLHLWIFRAGSTAATGLIGHRELDADQLEAMGVQNGQTARFTIPLTKEIAEEKPNVDVYAVLNGASAGFTLDAFPSAANDWAKVSPQDLEQFTFSGDYFGTASLTGEVPAAGLPMSGVRKNVTVSGSFPVLRIEDVRLTRAVSKLHFVFTQLAEGSTPVASFIIDNVTLSGQVGASEKLFTEQTLSNGALCDISGYSTLSKSWPTDGPLPSSLAHTSRPGYFLYDYENGMTSQEYIDRIREGIATQELTEWSLCYLRESDKVLSGTIQYRIGANDTPKTATFSIKDAGDFARNHSWTIYGYFIGGKLYVKPTVLPWIAGHDRLSYSTMGSTEMKYERPWLRYDLDQKSWTWDDTYVAIAYGYKSGSSGIPTRSPRITFETINQNDLRLQLNNDHFRLVQVTHSVDGEGNPIDVFTQLAPGASLNIPGSQDLQVTEVYVVPVSDDPMSDPYVKLMLTELHPGGIPPENLPFNHNLPGDEDHASILFYNPGATEWDNNKNTHKVSGDSQPGVYWLEEEV